MKKDRGDDEDLYLKPKAFRNRKSKPKLDVSERTHPVHPPYKRDHRNYLIEDEDNPNDWDFMYEVKEDSNWDGREEYLKEDEDYLSTKSKAEPNH